MSELQQRLRAKLAQEKLRTALAAQTAPETEFSDPRRQAAFEALTQQTGGDPNALLNVPKDKETVFGRFERENLPAIGATIATMLRRGRPAPNVRLPTNLPSALNRVIVKPGAELAAGAGKAAVGGGVGGLMQEGTGEPALDRFVNNAIEQGVTDPLAKITLGFGRFLLQPAGKVTAKQIGRVVDFARREGLALDPGSITGSAIPKMISTFAKGFFGSTVQSRSKLKLIAKLISANPEDGSAIIHHIMKEGPGALPPGGAGRFLAETQEAVVAAARGVRGKVAPVLQKAAKETDAGKAADLIFMNAAATRQLKSRMTKKEWGNFVTSHIDNMIKRSTKEGVIDGDTLGALIRENRTNLSQFYPGGVLDRLENLAVYAKAHRGVLKELEEAPFLGAQTFRTNIIASALTGGSLVAGADPTGVSASVIGLSTILASQVFNPNSVTSKWLTTGLVPKNVVAALAAEFAANVAVRGEIGEDVTGAGVTEAVREGTTAPVEDSFGRFVDRQTQRFRQ